MREVNAMPGLEIHLGRVGENMAVCVVLDVTDWRQTYGDGSVQLLHKRNGDQYPYPCAIEADGGRVCWPVTASDVAVAGKGWAELQYLVGEVCVKSETFATRVERALGNAGPTPPEPHEGWVQQVLEAGAQVEASAEEAIEAAARAQEHADSVAELKEVAVQAHEAAVEALEALEGIDEAQQAVAADRAAIEAMTVTSETLEPGEDATVEKIKQDGVMTLHFGIPTGDSGVYVGTTKPTDPNVRVWINPNGKANDNPGGGGGSGADGEDGGYYTPAVNNGVLTWEASKDDMPAVPSANIMGPAGADGKPGDPGKDGAQGPAGPAGADGLTPHIGANGNWFIGDEDTGVSAGGGGSTGGGGGQLELLMDVTTEEEVRYIYQSFDPVTVSELLVVAQTVGPVEYQNANAVGASVIFNLVNPDSQWTHGGITTDVAVNGISKASGAVRCVWYTVKIYEGGAVFWWESQENTNRQSIYPRFIEEDVSTVSSLRLDTQNWQNNFGVGTRVRIWGVKA